MPPGCAGGVRPARASGLYERMPNSPEAKLVLPACVLPCAAELVSQVTCKAGICGCVLHLLYKNRTHVLLILNRTAVPRPARHIRTRNKRTTGRD